ncbi:MULTISPECIES: TetR/AcrR family transcriptional regulator [Micromonospora]|uniref:TetR/AcrR family transcriptional regulator n=1 Tax=Micromonospora TaxID=1873 RepID=UPI0024A55BCE|nr:TetR/AcrR family transcriptional regulator [Micromonospora sp. NBRC 107095]GLZ62594.1 TetR family transcriptional regulator [Micromonospora sp. NBRC 107095]
MTAEPPVPATGNTAGEPAQRRRRDAAETRKLLLYAARQRFARDGYAATTVRDIADDAGVNVALISRYFTSKEGLFEACLRAAGDELRRTTGQTSADRMPEAIARHIADLGATGLSSQLSLLLRSSGDAGADEIRRGVLVRSSEQLAAARGWRPGEPGNEQILLRAQMALAAGIGVAVLRSSIRLEPLSSATEQDLIAPLRDLVDALLPPR